MQPAIRANFTLRYHGHLPTAATVFPGKQPLYLHSSLRSQPSGKKEEAAKICVLSGLVVQFFFLIFYFVFDRRFLDML